MSNEQNLIPGSQRSKDEVREIGRKGGIKSGESRRRKANLRKAAQAALEGTYTNTKGEELTGEELVIQSILANIADRKGRNYGKALETLVILLGAKETDAEKRKKEAEAKLLEIEAKNAEEGTNNDGVTIVWGAE